MAVAVLCACCALGGTAGAADSFEFWPEVAGFVRLRPRTRIHLDAAYAKGKESDTASLDASAFLDVSIKPLLRPSLHTQDWQRSRFFWARLGYTRVEKSSADVRGTPEDRASIGLYGKLEVPGEIWLESRVRADLRWIGGEYSTRPRLRLEATREFTVRKRPVVPYLNAEAFYDSRYSGWSRALYMAGAEVTVSDHFRYEVYLAHQVDYLPERSSLGAFGVLAKLYN
jgi:hypothetical protein